MFPGPGDDFIGARDGIVYDVFEVPTHQNADLSAYKDMLAERINFNREDNQKDYFTMAGWTLLTTTKHPTSTPRWSSRNW